MTATASTRRPRCDLFLPGHMAHWIQARKASDGPASWGKLVEVYEGWITVSYLDRTAQYRNHDADAVSEIAEPGAKVRVSERFRMLGVDLADHTSRGFCIALEKDQWRPCSYEPLTEVTSEALAERLESRGGFSVPGQSLEKLHGE